MNDHHVFGAIKDACRMSAVAAVVVGGLWFAGMLWNTYTEAELTFDQVQLAREVEHGK